jgi:myo-inositol-1(or 4)-monophosphatase
VEADFRRLIAETWPDHAVLGEEGPRENDSRGRCRWIIDPLDGTTNFAHGLALFCVSIALEVDGQIVLGVVYDPIGDELFTAERGGGARLNGLPIGVSPTAGLGDALLCTGFPYGIREKPGKQVEVFAGFLQQAQAVRRLGSAALDLCYVAAGRFDGFWEEHLHAWDMAAGCLIVEEAGGRNSRYDDAPVDLFGGQLVASNGRIHAQMRAVIDAHRR